MSAAKGYVVRGKMPSSGEVLYAFRYHRVLPPFSFVPDREVPARYADMGTTLLATLAMAIDAWRYADKLTDVRVFAVAEDGTEMPLPTYEEALSEIASLQGERDTALAEVPARLRAERERDEALAETERLRDRVDTMGADLQAAHGEIAALREERERERAAWARLVKATDAAATALMAPKPVPPQIEAEHQAAERALRDLGVNEDSLLKGTT